MNQLKFYLSAGVLVLLYQAYLSSGFFITRPPEISTGFVGSNITFQWALAENSSIIYKIWKFIDSNNSVLVIANILNNGTHETSSGNNVYASRISYGYGEAWLTLTNLTFADEGTYECEIIDSNGTQLKDSTYLQILVYPSFGNTLLAETEAVEDSDANLTCTVYSRPTANITWTYSGKLFNGTKSSFMTKNESGSVAVTRSVLMLQNVSREDTGSYECVAEHLLGVYNKSTYLSVLYKPENVSFTMSYSNSSQAVEGGNVIFNCSSNAVPLAYYEYSRNGVLIANTSSSIYIFNNISNDHEGLYQCQAINSVGRAAPVNRTVIVYVKPYIISKSSDTVDANVGAELNLMCKIVGDTRPVVQWTSPNTSQILNVTETAEFGDFGIVIVTSTVTINELSKSDAGVYQCIGNNSFGEISGFIKVPVRYPAFISVFPDPIIVAKDTTFNFTIACTAIGNPVPTLYWYKNRQLINVSDSKYDLNSVIIGVNNMTEEGSIESALIIKDVTMFDVGYYTCEAENLLYERANQKRNKTTFLYVIHEPYFVNMKQSYIVNNGSDFIFNCTVQAHPTPEVSWRTAVAVDERFSFNRSKVILMNNRRSVVESLLIIRNVRLADYGIYMCYANNTNSSIMWNATLFIRYSPQFISQPLQNVTVAELSLAQLECSIHSYPAPQIEWFRVNTNLSLTNITNNMVVKVLPSTSFEIRLSSRLLFPLNVTRNDYGEYICRIQNGLSILEASTYLNVEWSPEFQSTSISNSLELRNGSTNLTCIVQSNPIAFIFWRKDKENLLSITENVLFANSTLTVKESVLTLNDITPNDAGEYICIAYNFVAGIRKENRRLSILNVIFSPILIANSTNRTILTSESIELSCESRAYPPISNYKWTKDGAVMNFNESIYKISKVNEDIAGTYKCTPENSEGVGETVVHSIAVLISPVRGAIAWHKDWYIVLWVAIPIAVILLIILILWIARRYRASSKVIFVTSNNDIRETPITRNLSTRPDIYLPERSSRFSAVNNGFVPDGGTKPNETTEVVTSPHESSHRRGHPEAPSFPSPVFYNEFEEETVARKQKSRQDEPFNFVEDGNTFLHLYEYVADPPLDKTQDNNASVKKRDENDEENKDTPKGRKKRSSLRSTNSTSDTDPKPKYLDVEKSNDENSNVPPPREFEDGNEGKESMKQKRKSEGKNEKQNRNNSSKMGTEKHDGNTSDGNSSYTESGSVYI